MKYDPIIDEQLLGRDPTSKAVINLNTDAYRVHMKTIRDRETINNRLESVENDIKEIKDMFSTILSKLG